MYKARLDVRITDRGFGALSVGFLTETDIEPSLEQRATALCILPCPTYCSQSRIMIGVPRECQRHWAYIRRSLTKVLAPS